MPDRIRIGEVFLAAGQPTVTYVKRDDGGHDYDLKSAILNKGKLCLLTGPSKTGKTTLYKQVISELKLEPIVVRCDTALTPTEFWKRALEKINFDRITSIQGLKSRTVSAGGKIAGDFGWSWLLAKIKGEASVGISSLSNESKSREKVLSEPSPSHLIPVLKDLPYILVVEDFHYLNEETQKNIFQQWKEFIDEEITPIVLGTTHHAVDLAYANEDLIGRITHIELLTWRTTDLEKIVRQGFKYLRIPISESLIKVIAHESAGLPIITQQVCHRLFEDRKIQEVDRDILLFPPFTERDIYLALHNVAVKDYAQFFMLYERLLARSGMQNADYYSVYDLILSLFSFDPLSFFLRRYEITERIDKIPFQNIKKPDNFEIDKTLEKMKLLQSEQDISLLEWDSKSQKLYILKPSFLFFLRWRVAHEKPPTPKDVFANLLISGGDIQAFSPAAGQGESTKRSFYIRRLKLLENQLKTIEERLLLASDPSEQLKLERRAERLLVEISKLDKASNNSLQ